MLLQAVGVLLALELLLGSLQRPIERLSTPEGNLSVPDLRGSIGVEQDMAILEVLSVRSVVEMLL